MSSVLKKDEADKIAFRHQPKAFKIETSKTAKDFVSLQTKTGSDFQIATVVAQQSGIDQLRQKNAEAQVEVAVLQRLREIEEQAYKQAFELGQIEGAEKAYVEKKANIIESLKSIDLLIQTLDKIKTEMFKINEKEIVKLIHSLASRIAVREVQFEQEPLIEMLRTFCLEVESAENIEVLLNPGDLMFIETIKSKAEKDSDFLQRIKLKSDPDVSAGGCIVETNFGSIQGTIEERIDKAWKILEAKLPVRSRESKIK